MEEEGVSEEEEGNITSIHRSVAVEEIVHVGDVRDAAGVWVMECSVGEWMQKEIRDPVFTSVDVTEDVAKL